MAEGRVRGRASLGNWLLLLSIFLVACHGRDSASRPAAQTTDEIILITIDTWRADAVGFAGNTRVKTPFLDSLAARGTVFSNAHAHNVVTLPSHVNILTGLYPYQQGVGENAGFRPRCENRDAFRNTAARGGVDDGCLRRRRSTRAMA